MHVALKCQTAMYNLYKIRQIRLVLTEEACRTIIQGLVLSHLDFANSILAASLDNIIKMLQRVQNMAAKVILGKNRQYSALACLKKLHWLPIKELIKHKVLTLVYNCLNNNAPDCLKNLLTSFQVKANLSGQMRNIDNYWYPLPGKQLSLIGPSVCMVQNYGTDFQMTLDNQLMSKPLRKT